MSFFDSFPVPERHHAERAPRRPWERPDTVIPGSVPGERVLIRTDQVAVAIGSVRAYPNGFEFTVHIRWRHSGEAGDRNAGEPFSWYQRAYHEKTLRLGVQYADGRRIATTGGPMRRPGDPADLVLNQQGGGGDDRSWDQEFWLSPLPPDGPVTFVASWAEEGVAEARVELDAAPIHEAAGRAVVSFTATSTDEDEDEETSG